MTMGSSPGIQPKSRIPKLEAIESKEQVTIPERLPENLSADAQSPEVTKPRVERRVGEFHINPGPPHLNTKEANGRPGTLPWGQR